MDNDAVLEVTIIVGGVESMIIVTELFASNPSALKYANELLNLLLVTLTIPGVVLFAVGVNTDV